MTIQPGDQCEKCAAGYYCAYASKVSVKKSTRTSYYRCKLCKHRPEGNKITRELINPFQARPKNAVQQSS